jgi:hypothetical protein
VGDDADLFRGNAVELDEVVARPLGDRNDSVGRSRRARHGRLEDKAILPGHQAGLALEGEVVNGEYGAADRPKGKRVLVMAKTRPDTPEEPRQRPRHSHLLRAGRQLQRLDPGRHALGMARDRGEVELGRRGRQRPQQVLDVGLVAGALPSEHVGVDQDVDHAAASR